MQLIKKRRYFNALGSINSCVRVEGLPNLVPSSRSNWFLSLGLTLKRLFYTLLIEAKGLNEKIIKRLKDCTTLNILICENLVFDCFQVIQECGNLWRSMVDKLQQVMNDVSIEAVLTNKSSDELVWLVYILHSLLLLDQICEWLLVFFVFTETIFS